MGSEIRLEIHFGRPSLPPVVCPSPSSVREAEEDQEETQINGNASHIFTSIVGASQRVTNVEGRKIFPHPICGKFHVPLNFGWKGCGVHSKSFEMGNALTDELVCHLDPSYNQRGDWVWV